MSFRHCANWVASGGLKAVSADWEEDLKVFIRSVLLQLLERSEEIHEGLQSG